MILLTRVITQTVKKILKKRNKAKINTGQKM